VLFLGRSALGQRGFLGLSGKLDGFGSGVGLKDDLFGPAQKQNRHSAAKGGREWAKGGI
jgi:hypothetical protein